MAFDKNNIKNSIIADKIVDAEPFIYPMSAVRDEEIFRAILKKYVGSTYCIVETGTYIGISSCLLYHYCQHLHTFDIRDYPEREKIWRYAGISYNWLGERKCNVNFHHIKNDIEKKKIVDKLPKINFCFVDGHHKNGCDKDFEILRPHCNKFLFHDYCPEKCTGGEGLYDWMRKFLDSLMPKAKIVDIRSPFVYMEF